ncbi:unnamed protein product [Prorocentrum cordatum]|uniref:Uncharacterized protein n=1 Tax=Prorocentrum cordatum TaxID=2364126 RepID=A0ABN9WK83_9DINO|nr:unnamed protein product [Polarella glacialis]
MGTERLGPTIDLTIDLTTDVTIDCTIDLATGFIIEGAIGRPSDPHYRRRRARGGDVDSTSAPRRARDMPAQASGPAAGALDAGCEDASEGSLCHHSVTWLRESGFARHPEWYPGLSSDTSFEDVQMILHSLGKAECKKPCEHAPATYAAKQDDTDLLEVESTNGREISGEEVVLAPPQSCGNTTTGDWRSISIQWLRDSEFGGYQDCYPGLSHESTDREIQAELHRQGKVGCPEPCQEWRPDMTTITSTAAPSCTDAEEGSACFDAVMAEIGGIDIKVALDELASTFREVQERLHHSIKAGCTRPCAALHSQKVIDQRGYMKKPVEDMTMNVMKPISTAIGTAWSPRPPRASRSRPRTQRRPRQRRPCCLTMPLRRTNPRRP